MKLGFQQLHTSSAQSSIAEFWVKEPKFGVHWHYHPEIEICYVKQGAGHRIVGDSVQRFEDGDLVLVGSNLPHCWITDANFNASEKLMEVYVVHFNKSIFLNNLPEFDIIKSLIKHANQGISFNKTDTIISQLLYLNETKGIHKFLGLCSLLTVMAESNKIEYLTSDNYLIENSKKNEQRITKACDFIQQHFKRSISLTELADLVNMNPTAFSRFFKQRIGKSPINYLNEIRIHMACTQLLTTSDKVYEIAYDCGFSSLTHFNKLFLKHNRMTPKQYRLRMKTVI